MDTIAMDIVAHDIVIANDGTGYFTEPKSNSVWKFATEGSAKPTLVSDSYRGAFGITLSPDQSFVCVADYNGRHIWASQRAEDGSLQNSQAFYHLHTQPAAIDIRSKANGMAADRNGWLIVATSMGAQLVETSGMTHMILPPPIGEDGFKAISFGPDGKTLIAANGRTLYARPTLLKAAQPYATPADPAQYAKYR